MYVYVCLHRIQPVPSTKISSFRVARRGTRETARRGANASFEPSTPATETDRERESFSQLWHPKRSRNVACPRKSGRLIGRNVGSFGLSFRANRILPPKRRRETRTARRRDSNLSPGRRVSDRVTRISVNGGEKRVAAMPRTRIFAYEDRSATRWPVERGAWPAGLNRVLEGLRSRARRGESVTHEGGTKEPGVPTKALAGCPGFRQTTSSPLCGHPLLRFTPSPPPPPPWEQSRNAITRGHVLSHRSGFVRRFSQTRSIDALKLASVSRLSSQLRENLLGSIRTSDTTSSFHATYDRLKSLETVRVYDRIEWLPHISATSLSLSLCLFASLPARIVPLARLIFLFLSPFRPFSLLRTRSVVSSSFFRSRFFRQSTV